MKKNTWRIGTWNDGPCVEYPVTDSNGMQHWVPQNLHYEEGGAAVDAHLIAAAPDLLEACKEAADYMLEDCQFFRTADKETFQKLLAAIQKAEGKSVK